MRDKIKIIKLTFQLIFMILAFAVCVYGFFYHANKLVALFVK